MTIEGAISQVKTILEQDETLAAYIKVVYNGYRENIPQSMYPCIVLEPARAPEEISPTGKIVRPRLTLEIYAWVQIYDKDKQILGDASTKGIVDVMLDIKKALGTDLTLSSNCSLFEFPHTEFGRFEAQEGPFRAVKIDMEITLQQTFTSRS
jgi:hypothetical protein